eukprot:1509896-Amphidinium_carterae.1
MTGPTNVSSLRSTNTFVGKLQGGSIPFKLMCNNTSVRTGMSGARMVEPTTNGDIFKVLRQEVTGFVKDLRIDNVHHSHSVAKVPPKASRKAPKTIRNASIPFVKDKILIFPCPSHSSSNLLRDRAIVCTMNGGITKRFNMMINASMFTIGRVKKTLGVPEKSITRIDSSSSKGLHAMVFMVSAKHMVQKVGVQTFRLQVDQVPRLSVNPKNRSHPV